MNPIQMAIALHYINETTDYNGGDFSDTLVGNTIQLYKDQGLLEEQAVLTAIASVQPVSTVSLVSTVSTVTTVDPLAPTIAPTVPATLVATDGLKMYVDALSKISLPKQIWTL